MKCPFCKNLFRAGSKTSLCPFCDRNFKIDKPQAMAADKFYEEFKEILRYLGPGWAGMNQVEMRIKKNALVFTHGELEVTLSFGILKSRL